MTSYLSRLSPVPRFDEYTGPHKVGTIDVELPVSELEAPSPPPAAGESIPTIQCRIFYPCEPDAKGKSITWLPAPQRGYVSAYTRFLGAGSMLADFISYLPGLLSCISIPVRKNAPLLKPTTSNKRWPVMIFSHGLGGSRNAYSHLVGSIASHGVIVIAPEHRDGSAPVSYIREVSTSNKASAEKSPSKRYSRTVDYLRFSHTPSPEVEAGRNAQLKIRLWELGLIHDSILKVDLGNKLTNLNISSVSLSQFKDVMDVHTPGKITFAGHSFGAATITQFVKSTFYSPRTSEAPTDYEPLFTPSSRSSISGQITPQTPIILLDAWCLPLRAEATRWLLELPFPCYAQGGPGGAGLLAVESQAFYKWRAHLKATKRLLSPDPSSLKYDYKNGTIAEPNFFYASTSAHLSQSDFGVLFPWFTKKFLAVEEPERIMRLNVRAVMQLMRNSNIQVSATSHTDMEMEDANAKETNDDKLILGCNEEVRGWVRLTTNVEEFADEDEPMLKGEVENQDKAAPSDAVVGNELMKEKEGTAEKL